MEQQNTSLFQLNIDANVGMALRSAASWGRVIGILGIIFGVLLISAGIMVQAYMSSSRYGGFDDYGYPGTRSTAANMGMFFYLISGILTIIGSIFPLTFGGKASTALRSNDPEKLRSSFSSLRNYFAFWAILMILGLLLTIIGIAGGAMTRM